MTHSLTHSCLVNLIDMTPAWEDANSKLVEADTVAYVDTEDHAVSYTHLTLPTKA